jgi:outer membrane receptor protein involved in Fe transport
MSKITKLLTTLLFLSPFQHTMAQSEKGSINGQVIDSNLGEPLAYVNVIIKTISGKFISGEYTNEEGYFEIKNINENTFILSIQYIGYTTLEKKVVIKKDAKNTDLGILNLEQNNTTLDEITIIAETSSIQQKADRKVITIGKDLATSGTASELMVGIPSVNVDVQTGDISLRGNSNVQIMVDGKLSNIPTAQLLKQIPSTAIKSIELITNPSAKYNPEGMSGLINIVLYKNTMLGFNGSISTGISHEKSTKTNNSVISNYRNGKINIFANYSNNISKNINNGIVQRPANNSEQLFEFTDKSKNNLVKFGLDYYINNNQTISVFTNQNKSVLENSGVTNAIYTNNVLFNQTQLWTNDGDDSTSQYNLDYKINFNDDGHNLELEIDHNNYSGSSVANFLFPVGATTDYIDFNKTNRKRTTLNIDYANSVSENSKIELGLQANIFKSLILYESTGFSFNSAGVTAPTPNINFDYIRDIYSIYGNYNTNINKWSFQLGLRVENVDVIATAVQTNATNTNSKNNFTNSYFELYPSAYITYKLSEKSAFQLNYSRRVDRPGIGQINPIKEWSTPLVSSYGNSNLIPQFTNSLEFNYTRSLENGSVTFGTFFRGISDEINRALFIDRSDVNSGRLIFTHDNFDNSTAYGVELSSSYKPYNWWRLNGSFDLYSQILKGIAEKLSAPLETATINDIITETNSVDNIAWNFRLYNNFKINEKITFTAFGFYQGRNSNLQYDVKPMFYVNIGSRISFAKGKGSVSLNYNDIFNTMKFRFKGTKPYVQEGEFNWESNTVYLGINYRFGSTQFGAKSRKKRANDEKEGTSFL